MPGLWAQSLPGQVGPTSEQPCPHWWGLLPSPPELSGASEIPACGARLSEQQGRSRGLHPARLSCAACTPTPPARSTPSSTEQVSFRPLLPVPCPPGPPLGSHPLPGTEGPDPGLPLPDPQNPWATAPAPRSPRWACPVCSPVPESARLPACPDWTPGPGVRGSCPEPSRGHRAGAPSRGSEQGAGWSEA